MTIADFAEFGCEVKQRCKLKKLLDPASLAVYEQAEQQFNRLLAEVKELIQAKFGRPPEEVNVWEAVPKTAAMKVEAFRRRFLAL